MKDPTLPRPYANTSIFASAFSLALLACGGVATEVEEHTSFSSMQSEDEQDLESESGDEGDDDGNSPDDASDDDSDAENDDREPSSLDALLSVSFPSYKSRDLPTRRDIGALAPWLTPTELKHVTRKVVEAIPARPEEQVVEILAGVLNRTAGFESMQRLDPALATLAAATPHVPQNHAAIQALKTAGSSELENALAMAQAYKEFEGRVEVKPSDIAGAAQGLFATRDFAPSDQVSVYYGRRIAQPFHLCTWLSTINSAYCSGGVDARFEFALPSHLSAGKANDPYIDGEMLETLLSVDFHKIDSGLPRLRQFYRDYVARMIQGPTAGSGRADNIAITHSEPFDIFVATRKIKAGDEIYYAYGPSYWLNIPLNIAYRKGNYEAAIKIMRALSEEAEQWILKTAKAIKVRALVSEYITAKDYHTRMVAFQTARTPTDPDEEDEGESAFYRAVLVRRLMGLVAHPSFVNSVFNFEIRKGEGHAIEQQLDAIGALPNREFITPSGMRTHERVVALLKELVTAGKLKIMNRGSLDALSWEQFGLTAD